MGIFAPCILVWDTSLAQPFYTLRTVVPNHGRLLSAELAGDIVRCDIRGHLSAAAVEPVETCAAPLVVRLRASPRSED